MWTSCMQIVTVKSCLYLQIYLSSDVYSLSYYLLTISNYQTTVSLIPDIHDLI